MTPEFTLQIVEGITLLEALGLNEALFIEPVVCPSSLISKGLSWVNSTPNSTKSIEEL